MISFNVFFRFWKQLGSSQKLYVLSGKLLPWSSIACALLLVYGLVGGLILAPTDYQQGEAYRIIYVHVPCAILSLLIYVAMAVCGVLVLIWRIKVADIIAIALAPIGMVFAFCALVTGSLWGKPMWGTWWIWDARLTSELVLLFLYIGYMGLYNAIPNKQNAAKVCAILAVVGVVDIPIIHYSVTWWNTLHQGSTLQWRDPQISLDMLRPLLAMIVGLCFYTLTMTLVRIRSEMLARNAKQLWVRKLFLATRELS